jgi:hypothetical protein
VSAVEVTAGPFVDREGRWVLVGRRGGLIVRVSTRSRWEDYDLSGALTERAVDDLVDGLAGEFRISRESAATALLAHTRKASA